MIKTVSILSVLAFVAASSVPATAMTQAQIRECQAMGASIQVRAGEVEEMTAERDRALQAVEAAGQQWDDVEIHRNASKGHAAEADRMKLAYETQKSDFMKIDAALTSKSGMVNQSIVKYNERCTPKG